MGAVAGLPQWVVCKSKFPASIIRTFVEGTNIRFHLQTLNGTISTATYSEISPFTSNFSFDPEGLDLSDVFSKTSKENNSTCSLLSNPPERSSFEKELLNAEVRISVGADSPNGHKAVDDNVKENSLYPILVIPVIVRKSQIHTWCRIDVKNLR